MPDEAFSEYVHVSDTYMNGVDFGDTKALFNVGFYY